MLDSLQLKRIAHLARIAVSDDELARLASELTGILSMIDQMRAVDVSGVAPMTHVQPLTQPLRPDQVTEADQRARFLALAPRADGGDLYRVPKVLD
jgi:aspartyl-tRNA(Asn)/glutamyl-tRNA(Gln) amidotransferase subunit C